ncbi:hypothetical protein LTR85_003625 [Meristemomyces frigidus]|nr:hypothetical protein LTR85_003625 [Meristemomyces frigidus]
MALPSSFLDLPRELRNIIYEFAVLAQPFGIKQTASPRRRQLFTSRSSLESASKQVREEYLETVEKFALSPEWPEIVIEMPVMDMNFINLIALTAMLTPAERLSVASKLVVVLAFGSYSHVPLDSRIGLWLGYSSDVGLEARYTVKKGCGPSGGEVVRLRYWLANPLPSNMRLEEATKIYDALIASQSEVEHAQMP